MPPKKSNLGRRTRGEEAYRRFIANLSPEQRASRNQNHRQMMNQVRNNETAERRAARLEEQRLRARQNRERERGSRINAERHHQENPDQGQTRLHAEQSQGWDRLAFHYNPDEDYSLSQHVHIGTMTEVCPYCKALKFKGETKGLCCASGKIKLPQLIEPPEPLKTLLAGNSAESKHFLLNTL